MKSSLLTRVRLVSVLVTALWIYTCYTFHLPTIVFAGFCGGQLVALGLILVCYSVEEVYQSGAAGVPPSLISASYHLARTNGIAFVICYVLYGAGWAIENQTAAFQFAESYVREVMYVLLALIAIVILELYRRMNMLRASHETYVKLLAETRKELETIKEERDTYHADKAALEITLSCAANDVLHFSVLLTPAGQAPARVSVKGAGFALESLGRRMIGDEQRTDGILYRLRHPA